MINLPIITLMLFATIASTCTAQSEQEADLQTLKGTWNVVTAEIPDEDTPDEILRMQMVFDKDKFSLLMGSKNRDFKFEIDAAASPQAFRMKALSGNFKDKLGIGFYEFRKDALHLWLPNKPNADDPPKDLKDEKAKKLTHFEMQKVKEKDGEEK